MNSIQPLQNKLLSPKPVRIRSWNWKNSINRNQSQLNGAGEVHPPKFIKITAQIPGVGSRGWEGWMLGAVFAPGLRRGQGAATKERTEREFKQAGAVGAARSGPAYENTWQAPGLGLSKNIGPTESQVDSWKPDSLSRNSCGPSGLISD